MTSYQVWRTQPHRLIESTAHFACPAFACSQQAPADKHAPSDRPMPWKRRTCNIEILFHFALHQAGGCVTHAGSTDRWWAQTNLPHGALVRQSHYCQLVQSKSLCSAYLTSRSYFELVFFNWGIDVVTSIFSFV